MNDSKDGEYFRNGEHFKNGEHVKNKNKNDYGINEAKLKILLDILIKKEDSMKRILNITENQGCFITQSGGNLGDEMILEMNAEKQKLIDDVLQCDEHFQKIFNGFDEGGITFEDVAKEHAQTVKSMQRHINQVMIYDTEIRVMEEKNRKNYDTMKHPKLAISDNKKRQMIKSYAENSSIKKNR